MPAYARWLLVSGGQVEEANTAVAADVSAERAGQAGRVDLLGVVQQPAQRVGRQLAAGRVEDAGAAGLGLRQQPPAVLPPLDAGQLGVDRRPQPLPGVHRFVAA